MNPLFIKQSGGGSIRKVKTDKAADLYINSIGHITTLPKNSNTKLIITTKRGSPHLRKTPADEPVYQFLDKKRSEGKPYFVYMTAAQNKFLRIYYARVVCEKFHPKTNLKTFDS